MRITLLILALGSFVRAQEPARMLTVQHNRESAGHFGPYGAWLVQSQARWDGILAAMNHAGAKIDGSLGKVDFEKESLLCVFHLGDSGDRFLLHRTRGDARALEVQVAMSYIIYKQRPMTPPMWKLAAFPIARSQSTAVTVASFHPLNGGPYPTADKARAEWKWTFTPTAGEAVGGLTAQIEAQAEVIKPGQDIKLLARLKADETSISQESQFAPRWLTTLRVWDNKYSNGYRNDAYEVVTPDGSTLIVQKPVIGQWDKNVPHLVEIAPGKPYQLVNWAEGDRFKSLKERGLDTSKPGKYAITCIYQQAARDDHDDKPPQAWSGKARSNTVVVEVK